MAITSPTNGQLVALTYTITGSVSDESSGVAGVTVSVDNGTNLTAEVNGSTWSLDVTLSGYGIHTNAVSAADNAGNSSATIEVVVEVLAGVPAILISTPGSGIVTNRMTVAISGTSSVDTPYTVSEVQYKTNGGDWEAVSGTTSWSVSAFELAYGTNEITARVIADSGRTNESAPVTVVLEKVRVYVIASGSDANDGFCVDTAKATLPSAITAAKSEGFTDIRLCGDFDTTVAWSASFATNMTISGGWDTGFRTQSGASLIRGNGSFAPIINFSYMNDITLTNMILTKASAVSAGGGLYIGYSEACNLYLTLINNYASTGAGMYLMRCENFDIECDIISNKAAIGAGIYANVCNNMYFRGSVRTNYATTYAGGIYDNYGTNNTYNTAIYKNNGTSTGGGLYLMRSTGATVASTVVSNVAANGGGVYLNLCNNCFIGGDILSNYAATAGGGLYDSGGTNITFSATVCNNMAGTSGGGYYLYKSYMSSVDGLVSGNTLVTSYGGGLYLNLCNKCLFSGDILSNRSGNNGGGIYSSVNTAGYTNYLASSASVMYNHCGSSYTGGGVYRVNAAYFVISNTSAVISNYQGSGTTTINNIY